MAKPTDPTDASAVSAAAATAERTSWQGWSGVSPASASPWIDLSHPLHADVDRVAFFPAPRFERVMALEKDRVNVTELQMVCHFGTHIDAPCHFIPDAPAVHEIPLDRLYGAGVVWHLPMDPYGLIDVAALAAQQPAARPGDIVLLDTGTAAHFCTPRYAQGPALSEAAARWLVGQQVKLLGLDWLTPDLAVDRRPPGFKWPIHHILLSHGVLIAENLTNLESLRGQRVEVMALALNIRGADGAPARILARRVHL